MANHHVVVYNEDNTRLEVPIVTDGYLFERDVYLDGDLYLSGQINGYYLSLHLEKVDFITITGAVDLDEHEEKLSYITVTQAVDLDLIEARVNSLDAAIVFMGDWDASTLVFPSSTYAGESWVCTVAGVVDGVQFNVGDRVLALVDSAPPNSYAGYWLHQDYTDKVSSVAGKVGAVVLVEADITDLQSYILPVDIDSVAKLNAYVGDTLLNAGSINTLAELNAIVTDATLDDSGDARPPTAHTHARNEIVGFPFNLSYNYAARSAANGEHYVGGFYDAPAGDANLTDASPTVNYGSANASQGAHAFMVFGAGATDGTNITVTVTGTSITDTGTRTPADSEVLYTGPVAGLDVDDYLETAKRWIGQVTYTLTSDGVTFTCDFNYGFASYDRPVNGASVTLQRFVARGLANATDAGFDIEVLHHSDSGWSYDTIAFIPGGAVICQMSTDEAADAGIVDGEHFVYERTVAQVLAADEGILIRVTTSVNDSVSYLNAYAIGVVTYGAP